MPTPKKRVRKYTIQEINEGVKKAWYKGGFSVGNNQYPLLMLLSLLPRNLPKKPLKVTKKSTK